MKKNAYYCEDLHWTITQEPTDDVEIRLTTLFTIKCPICGKQANSILWKCNQDEKTLIPTHEFFMPEPEQFDLLSDNDLEHVKRGGLMFRKIPPKPKVKSKIPPG